jgi:geranylgeranyl diphosphate synthase type I
VRSSPTSSPGARSRDPGQGRHRSGEQPADLAAIARRTEHRLVELLAGERARWSELDPDLAEPLDRLTDAVTAGGKRLRPAFVHWGFAGADDAALHNGAAPAVVDAGAALEMLHTFALIHDDVVDDSDTRRGLPAMHMCFGAHHLAGGYRGEATRFGEGVAVLVGDLAHVYADVLAVGFPPAAMAVWNELRIELNIGQYLDVLGTARGDTDPARAARIARYKSAKYTIERPLHLGAALAGRLDDLADAYSRYGVPLGEAFQLRDDVLGVFGDEAVTGKPVGNDLREGKPTPLLALAVARASAAQRAMLELVGWPDLDRGDIDRCQQILVDTGAVAEIESEIERRRDVAIGAIAAAPIGEAARSALVDLAWYVTARDR